MNDSFGIDIPLAKLRPLRERKVAKREYQRIVASIRSVGLIEPLVVYPDADGYVITDGVLRFRALVELGAEEVPCVVGTEREAFTTNRMVNRVSPVQEHRMIQQSLGEVGEEEIAAALGISSLTHRLKKSLLKQLHPDVVAAYDADKLTRACARVFTHVKPPRQREIIRTMDGYKDYSVTLAKTLVVKTPPAQREHRSRKHSPWDKSAHKKNDLLKKLTEAEQRHDFYSQLYRQYTIDLLRLAIYARSLVTSPRLREYLDGHHPEIVARFERIIADARGSDA